ncbi:putative membrane-anchored protein [Mesorhizobium sp. URHB0026]
MAYYLISLDGILAFWLAYILTRPLGASFGDLLSQPVEYGGLGFGTTFTSLIFLGSGRGSSPCMSIVQPRTADNI